MPAKKKPAAEPKFEKDLEKLEKIVEELEEGGQSLDVSLKKFEEGIQLAQRCEKALSAAEKKIEVLTQNADGDPQLSMIGDNGPAVILRADAGGGRLLLVRDGEEQAIFLGHDPEREFSGATAVELREGNVAPMSDAPEVRLWP